MQKQNDENANRAPGETQVAARLTRREARIIFAEMVRTEMEAGLIRHSKRRQLLRYATKMGIVKPEACFLMARVLAGTGERDSFPLLSTEEIQDRLREAQQASLTLRKVLLAAATVAVVNLIAVWWLFS